VEAIVPLLVIVLTIVDAGTLFPLTVSGVLFVLYENELVKVLVAGAPVNENPLFEDTSAMTVASLQLAGKLLTPAVISHDCANPC
jgi:hypothetical protein